MNKNKREVAYWRVPCFQLGDLDSRKGRHRQFWYTGIAIAEASKKFLCVFSAGNLAFIKEKIGNRNCREALHLYFTSSFSSFACCIPRVCRRALPACAAQPLLLLQPGKRCSPNQFINKEKNAEKRQL